MSGKRFGMHMCKEKGGPHLDTHKFSMDGISQHNIVLSIRRVEVSVVTVDKSGNLPTVRRNKSHISIYFIVTLTKEMIHVYIYFQTLPMEMELVEKVSMVEHLTMKTLIWPMVEQV